MRFNTGGLWRGGGPIQEGASRCGAGVIALSHWNDTGFWMVQAFFKFELKETLATWWLLETVLSVTGLGMTLLLAALFR